MRKPISRPVLRLALAITSIIAVIFGIRTFQLQKNLDIAMNTQIRAVEERAIQKDLIRIDSILLQGKYEDAFKAYKAKSGEVESPGFSGIDVRMTLLEEVMRLKNEQYLTSLQLERTESVDSTSSGMALPSATRRKVDSLSFALEKANLQLQFYNKQMANKSYGEYLTFTNSKGSQMHYVGHVQHGKANGYGVALLNTGSRYVGMWKDNKRHGHGAFYWSDGEYYEGSFANDKRNGKGTYFWPNGEKYVGQWKDDMRSGEGIFYDTKGEVIADGVWKEDELEALDDSRRTKTKKR